MEIQSQKFGVVHVIPSQGEGGLRFDLVQETGRVLGSWVPLFPDRQNSDGIFQLVGTDGSLPFWSMEWSEDTMLGPRTYHFQTYLDYKGRSSLQLIEERTAQLLDRIEFQ